MAKAPTKKQLAARNKFKRARAAALKAGHKPFTKPYGNFIKKWFKDN